MTDKKGEGSYEGTEQFQKAQHEFAKSGRVEKKAREAAEAAAAEGDLPGAIDRAEGGRRRFRQPDAAAIVELSVLDARLRDWQRQMREDLREDAGR